MPNDKNFRKLKAQNALLSYIDKSPDLTYERALELLQLVPYLHKPLPKREETQNPNHITPSQGGMSPGRCGI